MHCAVAVNAALVPGASRMNRMRACDAVRRAAGPHRQVQPFLSGCGLGSNVPFSCPLFRGLFRGSYRSGRSATRWTAIGSSRCS
jgi:hypothetical protein